MARNPGLTAEVLYLTRTVFAKQIEYKCIFVDHRTHCLFFVFYQGSRHTSMSLSCPWEFCCCCCCFERTYFDLWASKLFYFPSDAQKGLPPRCGLIALISSLCSPSIGVGVREFYKEHSVRNVYLWITIGNVFKN